MIKEYRLSLKMACDVREKVQGKGGKFNLKFTQEIINSLLSHPELLNEFYLCRLIDFYHPREAYPFIEEEFDERESYDQFWENLKKIVTPEVNDYLEENVLGDNPYNDSRGNFLTDKNMELITQQLENFKIIQFSVEELKTGEDNTAGEPVVLLKINNNHAGT